VLFHVPDATAYLAAVRVRHGRELSDYLRAKRPIAFNSEVIDPIAPGARRGDAEEYGVGS